MCVEDLYCPEDRNSSPVVVHVTAAASALTGGCEVSLMMFWGSHPHPPGVGVWQGGKGCSGRASSSIHQSLQGAAVAGRAVPIPGSDAAYQDTLHS